MKGGALGKVLKGQLSFLASDHEMMAQCHSKPFHLLIACPELVEGMNSAKNL